MEEDRLLAGEDPDVLRMVPGPVALYGVKLLFHAGLVNGFGPPGNRLLVPVCAPPVTSCMAICWLVQVPG